MLSKFTVTYLLFVAGFLYTVRSQAGGLAKNTGCTCQAIDANKPEMVLKNFGIVMRCGGRSNCDCKLTRQQQNVQSCRNVCEQMVALWADMCPLMFRGKEVKAQFQSPTCNNAVGTMGISCFSRQWLAVEPVAGAGPAPVAGDGVAVEGPAPVAVDGVVEAGPAPVAGVEPVAVAEPAPVAGDGVAVAKPAPVAGDGVAVDGPAPVADVGVEPVVEAGPAPVAGVGVEPVVEAGPAPVAGVDPVAALGGPAAVAGV